MKNIYLKYKKDYIINYHFIIVVVIKKKVIFYFQYIKTIQQQQLQ